MIFKGTDKKAFKKAGKEKTPKARSDRYHKEKRKNEIQSAIKDGMFSLLSVLTSLRVHIMYFTELSHL